MPPNLSWPPAAPSCEERRSLTNLELWNTTTKSAMQEGMIDEIGRINSTLIFKVREVSPGVPSGVDHGLSVQHQDEEPFLRMTCRQSTSILGSLHPSTFDYALRIMAWEYGREKICRATGGDIELCNDPQLIENFLRAIRKKLYPIFGCLLAIKQL